MNFSLIEVKRIREAKKEAKKSVGPKHWTGKELMCADVPKPKFYVGNMIPEGLTIIVSPAKTGKSFLVSGLAIAICRGTNALGHIPTNWSEVLYLDMEQNPSKAKSRWEQVLCGERMPEGLHIFFEWKPFDKGGLQMLEMELDKYPAIGVVFVDVFTKVKPTSQKGANAYDQEYAMLADVKAIADKRKIAIVVVHHTNRTKSEDPLDTISGTNAMSGAPDALWILSRARGKTIGKLYVTGRAASEGEYSLIWSPAVGMWTLSGQQDP